MSSEESKAVARRFVELLCRGDAAAADELLTADHVLHHPSLPEPTRGRDAWKQVAAAYFAAFPDFSETVEEMIAEGDTVASRVTWSGTHAGDLMGIPPTGKRVTVQGMRFYRVADGRVAAHWGADDLLGLMRQLGALPAPGQGAEGVGRA